MGQHWNSIPKDPPLRIIKHRVLLEILVCAGAIAGFAASAQAQTTAPNEWTWIGGSNTVSSGSNGQPGVYGTLGTAAVGNIPGGRDGAATWTDSNGNFWLFGGEGIDVNGSFGALNDLWEFSPSNNQWTWMGGSSAVPASCAGNTSVVCGQPGVYGTLGSASAANIPGGRAAASFWTDSSGNFWLFGGAGFGVSQDLGDLNDLWKFNPSTKQWTWIGGSSNVGQSGTYGKLGTTASANIPSGRDSAANWTDSSGNFWLFGGEGADSGGNVGQLNDVWKFDPTANTWAWMAGNNTLPAACATSANNGYCGWPAIYGALGVAATGIGPGSRLAPATWTDKNGNFWLFGGIGSLFWESDDFTWATQYDLWEFNPSTQQWAWMSGNSTSTCSESTGSNQCPQDGIFGTQGSPSVANIPPSRDSAIPWTDGSGNFWLLGGAQSTTSGTGGTCNDQWVYEPAANEWAWMGGSNTNFPFSCFDITPGTYGTRGTPAIANLPSGRTAGASWVDSAGNLWLFGGRGYSSGTGFNDVDLNDVWVFQPAAPTPQPSFEVIALPNPINIGAVGADTAPTTTGTTTVNVVVAGGFDSPVALTANPQTCNSVTCITGSFSPATVTGAGSSTLTISVTGSLVQIPYPIPLIITGTSGSNSQTVQVIADVTSLGNTAAPTFSVPTGTYATPQTVSLSDTSANMFIYYTTDGSTPTASSAVYVSPITMSSTTTMKAIVISVFNDQSPVAIATYTFAAATPAISPGGGTYSAAQTVTLTDSTSGAKIYYTTDGSTPTTSSAAYSGPITVSSTETINAVASASGYALSAVATAIYTINEGAHSFTIAGTAITVAPGATAGNASTVTLTPVGGFTGAISLSCAITPKSASDPATCSIPASVTLSGSSPQTTTLTVNTSAATSAVNRDSEFMQPWLSSTAFACILLVGIPASRRRRWGTILKLILLFSIIGNASSCGGAGGGGGANTGTTPGAYVITVTGTSGTTTETGTISLSVQ
jgi:N-acetylneuraminic acid mutarotase